MMQPILSGIVAWKMTAVDGERNNAMAPAAMAEKDGRRDAGTPLFPKNSAMTQSDAASRFLAECSLSSQSFNDISANPSFKFILVCRRAT